MTKISFSQTITGQERKTIAAVIAQAINETSRYVGPPSFAFTVGGWSVGKQSQVISPVMNLDGFAEVKNIISALHIAGLNAETLRVTLHGVNENTAKLLTSVIKSKETLLKKALQMEEPLTVMFENEEATLHFFTATLDAEKVNAYLTLALKLVELAGTLKYSSATEKPVDNEKYALRCFLLRLGFIGDEFKTARRVLLSAMSGNGAFKSKSTSEVDSE